ncbi:hypothetical protein [Neobacillus massiliamazoniensis]|uniref:hypothetical protein n=1 Tax=Neobacillus massiliamazoniensis TaxID=1499688 RepID=UPI000AC81068|nr:hypothetical protein [Neobacillus massiliamazoniensis]
MKIDANYIYEESGILYKVYHLKKRRIKVSAKVGNITVIEFGSSIHEAYEKATFYTLT